MHGNDEFRQPQMPFLLRVCKIPYAPEYIVRQIRSLEYLLCGFAYAYTVRNQYLKSWARYSHT